MTKIQIENLTKAAHCAQFTVSDLRAAHSSFCEDGLASRLMEAHLLPIITEACALADKINLLFAIATDETAAKAQRRVNEAHDALSDALENPSHSNKATEAIRAAGVELCIALAAQGEGEE